MPFLSMFENPWCLLSLLLLICLLLIAAALLSLSRSTARQTRQLAPLPDRRLPQLPPPSARSHELTATAPFEALTALQERLAEIQRHLPPNSHDARWLESYLHDLRSVMDDVYWSLYHTHGPARAALLERLGLEVQRLDQTIHANLSATLDQTTDRQALHSQLDHLRRAVEAHGAP